MELEINKFATTPILNEEGRIKNEEHEGAFRTGVNLRLFCFFFLIFPF